MLLNDIYAAEVCGFIEADQNGTHTAKVLFYNRGRAIPVSFFLPNTTDKAAGSCVTEFIVGGFGQGLTATHAHL